MSQCGEYNRLYLKMQRARSLEKKALRREEIREHLKVCETCRGAAREWKERVRTLRRLTSSK